MSKYFGVPFAESGDKTTIDDASQPDGTVSFTDGYTPDYEKNQITDVDAKDVSRQNENYFKFTVTDALKEIQEQGFKPYDPLVNYPVGAIIPGSNHVLYKCKIKNGPGASFLPVEDPTVNTTGAWIRLGVKLSDYNCNIEAAVAAIGSIETAFVVDCPPDDLTGDIEFPETMSMIWGFNVPIGGPHKVTFLGTLYTGREQIFKSDITGVVYTKGKLLEIYPQWYGIDGVDDQVEINAALSDGSIAEIKVKIPWLPYDISDTVVLPVGFNQVEMLEAGREISTATLDGGFVWSGGDNKNVVEVYRQKSGRDSYMRGISVLNANLATGMRGFKFYDNLGSAGDPEGGSNYGACNFSHLSVSRCEVGYQLGDKTNDGWSTNFNHCVWEYLKTFDCPESLTYDSDNSDGSVLRNLIFNTGTAGTAPHALGVLSVGNQMRIEKVMISTGGVADDNYAINIQDGDGVLDDVNIEGAGGTIGSLKLEVTSGARGRWKVTNFREADANTLSDNYSMYLDARSGLTLSSIAVSGHIFNGSWPIDSDGVLFYDGFNFAGDTSVISHDATMFRSGGSGTTVSVGSETGRKQLEFLDSEGISLNFANMHFYNTAGAVFLDEVAAPVFTWDMVDSSSLAVRVVYSLGRMVPVSTGFLETGVVYFNALSDNTGNITASTPKKEGDTQSKDGYDSLVVTFSVAIDAGNNTVTLELTQNNELGDDASRAQFHVEIMAIKGSGNPDGDRSKLTWDF